jgi:predicted ATP-grasp superfamily ATP-dependent carboligase
VKLDERKHRDGPWPQVILLDPYNAGLALARRMVRLGASVTVVEGEPLVAHSRGVRGVTAAYQRDGERWLAVLDELTASADESVVLTGTDRASAWLVYAAERLPANLHAFERSDSAHLELMNKEGAERIARRAGVRVPWSAYARRAAELEALLDSAPWPCVVKPLLSHEWRDRYGERRAFLVSDADAARRLIGPPLEDGFEMLLSQYIPGDDDDVEEAILVRLADGSYPVSFGVRKLRQYPAGFGETALGESSLLPETTELARRVLDEAGFVGVAGVEAKRHAESGERWFLEVNVRLPGQWGLGDACGVEASPRLVAALAGRPPSAAPPLRPGVRFVQADLDWHGVLPALRAAPMRERPRLAWRLLGPYLGAGELGILDPRDPGPLLALARQFLRRRASRLTDRLLATRRAA